MEHTIACIAHYFDNFVIFGIKYNITREQSFSLATIFQRSNATKLIMLHSCYKTCSSHNNVDCGHIMM